MGPSQRWSDQQKVPLCGSLERRARTLQDVQEEVLIFFLVCYVHVVRLFFLWAPWFLLGSVSFFCVPGLCNPSRCGSPRGSAVGQGPRGQGL